MGWISKRRRKTRSALHAFLHPKRSRLTRYKSTPLPCSVVTASLAHWPFEALIILLCVCETWKRIWTVRQSTDQSLRSRNAFRDLFIPDHYDSVFLSVSTVISFLPLQQPSSLRRCRWAQHSQRSPMECEAKKEINRENIAAGSHIFILLWTSQL